MTDVFISYARSTAAQAQAAAAALRDLGYSVWLDDALPAHRAYAEVIEEQLTAAKAALVIWSADAVRSEWVMSEATRARETRKLVQFSVDRARLPMPFDQIQCADLQGWTGNIDASGWRTVLASIADLTGAEPPAGGAPVAPELTLPNKPSIAVMPFANLSHDPDQDYFVDGMVEEVANALSRFKSIFVIASGSTRSFKGKAVSPQEVARLVGVRYLLEGNLRLAGARVRITVKLIDTTDGAQVWSERFEDTLDDVFALQDRVALSVAGKIAPTVALAEVRRSLARPTDNMDGYDLYLRAAPHMRTIRRDSILQALDLYERSIALDPDFGVALALGAMCAFYVAGYQWSEDPVASRRQAIRMARRAIQVAGDDAQVLAIGANVLGWLQGDLDAAIDLADQAFALNPGSALVATVCGWLRLRAGEADLAVEHLETAMRLDPLGPDRPVQMGGLGMARFQQGRYGEAVAPLREYVQATDIPTGYAVIAANYGQLGQGDEAMEALSRYRTLTPLPIEDIARTFSRDPSHIQAFIDGIALAEGRGP